MVQNDSNALNTMIMVLHLQFVDERKMKMMVGDGVCGWRQKKKGKERLMLLTREK